MRVVFTCDSEVHLDTLCSVFRPIAHEHGMDWSIRDNSIPRKVAILVSKFDHCLGDLLYR
jgi:formyltetrahydrofolate deformylase